MSEMAANVPEDLVTRAMTGDRMAVEDVITTIRPLVVRYCRARLGRFDRSSVSADDVAQEVCLAVLTALPGYRVQGRPFLAFVYGIASHKVIDAHRAATRNRSEPVSDVPDRVESADGPEQHTLRVELSEEMGKLLDKLPEKQREISGPAGGGGSVRGGDGRGGRFHAGGGSGGPAPGAGPAPQVDARGGGGLSASAAQR